ncbi:hypothetical protein OG413_20185 [Streptomyces sp. NBC_01433]|uniref:hypothetical protein n=1 Tax=Streptomyces sp. NBC_01433 TaxID=2903864 RepID=UPI0022549132|nr:hypothetical protein [Streptomyces sp. NBC_01433]MCX4677593.1 hypothetical protein [Streptomyces sp. NBC_01433]
MDPETLARLAATRAHRDLSDLARQGVGSISSGPGVGERIEAARRLRVLVNELVDLVVLSEALGGASWEEITRALRRLGAGTVQAEYEEAVREWRAGPAERQVAVDDARDLDTWYLRHREDTDPPVEKPASELLQRD